MVRVPALDDTDFSALVGVFPVEYPARRRFWARSGGESGFHPLGGTMLFWIIAGLVLVAVAILYWRSQRKVKASGNSLGGMQSRAANRSLGDGGRYSPCGGGG